MIAAGGALLYLWPRCEGDACPSVESLRTYTPPQASRVYDRSGELIAHLAPERRIVVPLERIPARVAGAFLAVEDRRFFEHHGVDYRRAVGAFVRDVQTMSFAQGFSTITMQLARGVFPQYLTREKTLKRKVWEIVVARQIEREFSKDEILEMYLNQIYLGNGFYGVEAAAEGYFGKPVSRLTSAEAAMLAAIPKAPSTYDPRRNPIAAIERRNLVLSIMADAGVITPEAAKDGQAEPLDLAVPSEAVGDAPYFIAAVRQELRDRFGDGAETAGYQVYTTVDLAMQKSARKELDAQLAEIEAGKLGPYQGPKCSTSPPEDPRVCLQGLVVALDVHTGDVLALVGGRDFALSQFDRALLAKRQPGSSFKPFVYATALASGIPISTILIGPNAPPLTGDYIPADHVADSVNVNLRDGLRLSSNQAAVALGQRVGVDRVVTVAHELGLTTDIPPYPSTVLGTSSVIPIEMASAYTAFANGGVRVAPRMITKVEDSHGRVLYEAPIRRQPVFSPEVAFLTTSLMADVVDSGTAYRVRQTLPEEVPAAGKTGTTDDNADAWFIGITPDVATAVWVGFDQRKRIMVGAEGGNMAAPVWARTMATYYQTHPIPAPWSAPFDLVSASIDHETGELATTSCPPQNVQEEWFLPGTEPTEYCHLHPGPGLGGWLIRRVRNFRDWFGGRDDADAAQQDLRRPNAVQRDRPRNGRDRRRGE